MEKKFFCQSGFLGVGTKHVEAGDIVTFIEGMMGMNVIRPFWDGYQMVGFANVSGLMNWDDLYEAIKAGTVLEEELKIYREDIQDPYNIGGHLPRSFCCSSKEDRCRWALHGLLANGEWVILSSRRDCARGKWENKRSAVV